MARAPLRAGDPARIGHYQLTARLGSGGMGVVYLGARWDGGQVAVKVLRPELADDPDFRRRFGSSGFMAPEQISGRPGQQADIFVWGVTVAYAATGRSPFGTGDTHAVLYRVLHGEPDIAAVPEPLLTLVAAALVKDPDQLLDRLTSVPAQSPRAHDSPTQTILSRTWQQTAPPARRPRPAGAPRAAASSLLLQPAPAPGPPGGVRPGSGTPGSRRGRLSRRTTAIGVSALAAAAVAVAVVLAVLRGNAPGPGPTANEAGPGAANPVAANTMPTYPGQLTRGVFHTIQRIVASGNTMVTTGSSTDSGAHWTPVTVPVDHGAQDSISGVSFDGAGFALVRPGRTAGGASDGVAYFSSDGRTWQYAGTIAATGGWTPDVVKGSDYGFVVTGHTGKQYVAYTSTGRGTTWRPTGPLGGTSDSGPFTPAVGPGGNVIAAGSANSTKTSQEALLVKADTAGDLEPVSLSAIPGGLIPEEAVRSLAVAGTVQIAAGSADGYPAVWRRVSGGPWSLVSSLDRVSAGPGLAGLSAVQAAAGPRGYVITGTVAQPGGGYSRGIWWSPDLVSWTRAHDANETSGSSRVLAVAAGPAGFVSAGARDHLAEVWTSPDGRTWTAAVLPRPAGVIQQVAVNGNHAVALGQLTTAHGILPLAEQQSGDRGQTWHPVPFSAPGPGISFTALTASAGGFTAAAQVRSAGGTIDAAIWTSADGKNWTQSQVTGLTGSGSHDLTALAASGAAVTGIASVQTQASQQFVVRRLPAG